MAIENFANEAATTTTESLTAVATTVKVTSAAAFPATGQFRIRIDNEIMLVTAGAGSTTWTVTRAAETLAGATTAATHSSGATVTHVLTAAGLAALLTPPWIKVETFTNSWIASTTQFKPSYRKVGDRVELQGAISGGTSGNAAFTLPVGLRPAKLVILQGWSETLEVTTGGEVKPNGTAIAHLTGQSFSTATEPA